MQGLNVGQKARQGVLWVAVGQTSTKLLSFVSMMILARLLIPKDFGLVAIAKTVLELVKLFGNIGISAALIHQQEEVKQHATAAFWMNIFIAIILAVAIVIVAPFATNFYKEPQVQQILLFFAAALVLTAPGTVHGILLRKEMQFQRKKSFEMLLRFIQYGATIALAFKGFGVWSLVIPELIVAPIKRIGFWILCSWRPTGIPKLAHCRAIFSYGKHILGNSVMTYLNINADYALIGKFLNSSLLGIYTFAYNFANLPVSTITWVITEVAFPAFSKLQKEIEHLRSAYLKMVKQISLISFPVAFGLMILAPELIPTVFGDKWAEAIIPFQMLLIFGAARSIASPGGQLLFAIGRPDIVMKYSLVETPFTIGALILGIKIGGLVGLAAIFSVVSTISCMIFLYISTSQVGIQYGALLKTTLPALLSSCVMFILLLALKPLMIANNFPNYLILSVLTILGASVYFVSLWLIFRNAFMELYDSVAIAFRLFGSGIYQTFKSQKLAQS